GSAVLGVAQAARAGEALLLAGNVIGDAREGRALDDRFAGRQIDELVGRVDPVILDIRPGGIDVHDHLQLRRGELDDELVRGRSAPAAAGEIVDQLVAQRVANAGDAGAVGRIDL